MSDVFFAFVLAAIRAKSRWYVDEDEDEDAIEGVCKCFVFQHPWLEWGDLVSFSRADKICRRRFKECRDLLIEKSIVFSQRIIDHRGRELLARYEINLGNMHAVFDLCGIICFYEAKNGKLRIDRALYINVYNSPSAMCKYNSPSEMCKYIFVSGRSAAVRLFSTDFFDLVSRESGEAFQQLQITFMKVGAEEIFAAFERIDL